METTLLNSSEAAFEGIGLLDLLQGDPILDDLIDEDKCWVFPL